MGDLRVGIDLIIANILVETTSRPNPFVITLALIFFVDENGVE